MMWLDREFVCWFSENQMRLMLEFEPQKVFNCISVNGKVHQVTEIRTSGTDSNWNDAIKLATFKNHKDYQSNLV